MLERKFIRDHVREVEEAIRAKGYRGDLKRFSEIDRQLLDCQKERESIQQEKNATSRRIVNATEQEKKRFIEEMKAKDARSDELRRIHQALEDELASLEAELPNLPRPDVKIGKGEKDNEILREVGVKPTFQFPPQNYLTIAERLDLIDMRRAAKVSGSRFGYLKGELVQLQFALLQYALSVLLPRGFRPVVPPVLVRENAMAAMGYLAAHGDEETYHLIRDGLFLVGTSEQSIGPMHRDEVFAKNELPIRYVAYSTCFRRESGSYGKDTKGILRVHQFDKLEMFSFTDATTSDQEHEFLLSMEERLMQGLQLPYRVVKMATGDLGVPAARKYDIETWLPSNETYRETHSTSTCTDYQSRRLNIRYKDGASSHYVHTLNGTAFAMGRTLIAIIENFQTQNGGIRVPNVLQPYVPFKVIGRE